MRLRLIRISNLDGTRSVSDVLVLILFLNPSKGKTAFIIGCGLVADDNIIPSVTLWLKEFETVINNWIYPELQSLISIVEAKLNKRDVTLSNPAPLFGLVEVKPATFEGLRRSTPSQRDLGVIRLPFEM